MIDKPQLQSEVAIVFAVPETRKIDFCATPDAAGDIAQFGDVMAYYTIRDRYLLNVDPRFNFDEVVAWIRQTYCQTSDDD